MSYVAREPPIVQKTAHCVMTDVECIVEALEKIGATVQGQVKQNQDIKITLNRKTWTLNKQIGRYAVTHMSNQNVNWITKLTNQYNKAETQKRERLRKERERQRKLHAEMEAMNARAAEAERQGQSQQFEAENAKVIEQQKTELAQTEKEIAEMELVEARIMAQKEELTEARTNELVQRGELRNWNVQVQKNMTRRRTKIRLTR